MLFGRENEIPSWEESPIVVSKSLNSSFEVYITHSCCFIFWYFIHAYVF